MTYHAAYIDDGFGRSEQAREAEREGKAPLTRAAKKVAIYAGITQVLARQHLLALGPCEWHHVGLYAHKTDYYDWRKMLRQLADEGNERACMFLQAGL